jgi:hypothetical protein
MLGEILDGDRLSTAPIRFSTVLALQQQFNDSIAFNTKDSSLNSFANNLTRP